MQISTEVQADHHAFVLGSLDADPAAVTASGSVLESGTTFIRVLTGIANGPVSVAVHVGDPSSEPDDWDVVEECEIRVVDGVEWLPVPGGGPVPDGPNLADGTYGVRVSARGRDVQWDMTVTEPSEQYLIEIWPARAIVPFRRLRKVDSAWPEETAEQEQDRAGDPGEDASRTIRSTMCKGKAVVV